MIAIVGLGNPGYEYEWTRHNLGFKVVDELCETLKVHLKTGKGNYLIGTGCHEGHDVALVKPLTYMNNSGIAILDLVGRYKLLLENLLVVCDDFHLPLGTLRLRPSGSDGGHNGLYSIIYHLQTEKFPRLRCGIGQAEMQGKSFNATQFVLSVFEKSEMSAVKNLIRDARNAVLSFVKDGLVSAMDRWNTPRKGLREKSSPQRIFNRVSIEQ